MANLKLSLKLLWRDWRGGELLIVGLALMLAVTVISTIALVTNRLQQAFIQQSQTFLAAESAIQSSKSIPIEWLEEAQKQGLATGKIAQFPTMIQHQGRFQIAAVKAVSSEYPLMGHLEIKRSFDSQPVSIKQAPPIGEVWLEPHLMRLLDVRLGDKLTIGEVSFVVSAILEFEPDRGLSFINLGARLMMNLNDLEATGIIQPGSRIRYRLLLGGGSENIASYLKKLEPTLTEHDRVLDLNENNPRVAKTIERASSFLYLTGSLAVMLACVAIVLSCRRYSLRHTQYVAVIKSLGLSQHQTFALYAYQVFFMAFCATLMGLACAWILQHFIAHFIEQLLEMSAPAPQWKPLIIGGLAGLLCTLGFALPSLWQLSRTSPMKTLQQDWSNPEGKDWLNYIPGPLCFCFLIAGLTNSLTLTLALITGLTLLLMLARLTGLFALMPLSRLLGRQHPRWRLVTGSLHRRQGFNTLILAAFGTAFLALATLYFARTSLLHEWRLKIPVDAPNHFLVNIAPHEKDAIQSELDNAGIKQRFLYPSVRARVTAVNDIEIADWPHQDNPATRRELNLSWSKNVPIGNNIEAGRWWQSGDRGISIEEKLAKELGVTIGDRIHFSAGGLPFSAEIINIRSLSWDTMTPNFFMLFSPGTLDHLPQTYIGSFYLPKEQKPFIVQFIQRFPTVTVIEVDKIIDRIQTTIHQVSFAIEGILALMLFAGALVLLAGVRASISERLQEAALVRALGAQSALIRSSILGEFMLIGFCSGGMAAIGSELALAAISHWALELPITFHTSLWLFTPLMGAIFIGALGTLSCQSVVQNPPMKTLRNIA